MASVDEIWLTDFGAAQHAEPASRRPSLVVGPPEAFGVVPFVIVVPMTTVRRGLSWHVEVEHDANNGLSETSYVQCELLRAVSRERLVRRLGPIDAATSAEVSDVLRTLLNLGRW